MHVHSLKLLNENFGLLGHLFYPQEMSRVYIPGCPTYPDFPEKNLRGLSKRWETLGSEPGGSLKGDSYTTPTPRPGRASPMTADLLVGLFAFVLFFVAGVLAHAAFTQFVSTSTDASVETIVSEETPVYYECVDDAPMSNEEINALIEETNALIEEANSWSLFEEKEDELYEKSLSAYSSIDLVRDELQEERISVLFLDPNVMKEIGKVLYG